VSRLCRAVLPPVQAIIAHAGYQPSYDDDANNVSVMQCRDAELVSNNGLVMSMKGCDEVVGVFETDADMEEPDWRRS
jgi:hypothetical protein